MKVISLNGSWTLYYNLEKGSLPGNPSELKRSHWPSIPAIVPGNVELDLFKAGIEQDPFFGDNIYSYRKYEIYQWWYEREFNFHGEWSPSDDLYLQIDGIDTFATIWLNDQLIGRTNNMLMAYEFEVTSILRRGRNTITIRIESAIRKAAAYDYPVFLYGNEGNDEICWLRKPAHCFGWDIAPRFTSAGIWKDVCITRRSKARITELYFATISHEENRAVVLVSLRWKSPEPCADGYRVRICGRCKDATFETERALCFTSHSFLIHIEKPMIWNPRGYGRPNVYTVVTELYKDGSLIDIRKENMGIRTVEFLTEYTPDRQGSFQVIVNSIPVMVLGTNWVALDAFHSRDRSRLGRAFRLVDDLDCNMIRCWGGNVYEQDAFYNLCDRKGVMVWQDFSFACSTYPHNPQFFDIIQAEVAQVIKRLRNHPSLIVWVGDNEVDQNYANRKYQMPHVRRNAISRDILPACVRDHDPYRFYLPSSPYIPENQRPDQYAVPEQHLWGPRDYYKGSFYKDTTARFISEIGYHGCPALSTLESFISMHNIWPCDNSEWQTHSTEYIESNSRSYNRIQLMIDQVETMFGSVPTRVQDFILASQVSQAEALKFFIETVRSQRHNKTGIIWWNLLDCWPQISDAIVDYYFRKKIAYYYIRRSQQPVCVILTEHENWKHEVVVDNCTIHDVPLTLMISDGDNRALVFSSSIVARANTAVSAGYLRSISGKQRLYIIKWEIGEVSYYNHYVSGFIPYDLKLYKIWLKSIESLTPAFSFEDCCR